MEPLLSIVISNYNYGRFLEDAICSILDQGCPDVELIVVDGGSTDNSVNIIKKYSDRIAWWVSERDHGQSDAFNKGFARASGKYLTWLNADDVLVGGALPRIIRELRRHPDCHWFTGNFYRFTPSGEVMEVGWGPHWYPDWLQRPNSPLVVFGPTTFFSKEIYERAGRIDESLHYIMDNDLWLRFMKMGIKQRRIRTFCWGFRMHEESKTAEFGEHRLDDAVAAKMRAEGERVNRKTGYRPSKAMRIVQLMLRVLDGSILRRWYYVRVGVPR